MDDFATRLRRIMFDKNIKQTEIAAKTGVNKGNVSRWVSGENMPYGENLAKLASVLGVTVDQLIGNESLNTSDLTIPKMREVPIIGKVAAGVPIHAQVDIIGTVMTEKNVFALRVKGDSMAPRIMDGDIVLVRQQDYAEDGDLVIAQIEDDATCKVFKKNRDSVSLVPFNAVYSPLVYTKDDIDRLHILGKVVESRHEW